MDNLERSLTEKQFQQQVVDYARLCGWHVHFTWGSIHSPAGFPDLVLVRGDQLRFVELKSAKGKLTQPQEEWLRVLRQVREVKAGVVWPKDWAQLESDLR
jgi:hypothetical protein